MKLRALTGLALLVTAATLVGVVAVGTAAPGAFDSATAQYPDLKTLTPRDLRFDRADVSQNGSGTMHNVLRFTNTVINDGDGPLEMRGTISPTTRQGNSVQRIFDGDGDSLDQTVGLFYWHAVHSHYHYDDWGNYQLWPKASYDAWVASGRQSGNPLDVGTKTTSCILDEEFIKTKPNTPYPGNYPLAGCSTNSQGQLIEGLSPGWGDTYDHYRFEQWIDLDQANLANGQYVLRSVTDPLNKIYESPNKADASRESVQANEAITVFTVQNGSIVDSDKPSGTLSLNNVDSKTANANVTARVIGRDDVSGVNQFRLSNNGTTWATYNYTTDGSTPTTKAWDLTNATYGGNNNDGTKTVYAQVKDVSGKWSDTFTDTIVLDRNLSTYATTVMGDSPVSFWRLSETSGTSASDATGANGGAYRNGVALGVPGLVPSDAANTAARFDGSNDSVAVPTSSSLNMTQRVSVEAWIKPDAIHATGSFASVISKPDQYALQFNGPRLEFTIMQNGARRRAQAPVDAIVAGQTYHVVGTYDGSNVRLYVNGSEVAALSLTGAITTSGNDLTIGSWNGSVELLRGTIDDVAVYSTALSASRVLAHRDAGLGAGSTVVNPPSGLVAIPSSSSRIDVQWADNSANETSFELQRATTSSFASPQTFTLAADVVKYFDTTLAPGTTYYYRVRAVGPSTSGWSNVASATTPGLPSGYAGAVQSDNPVSYWRLGETSGSQAADQKSANPGTYVNGPALGATSLVASDTANPAVGFDGLDDHVAVPDSPTLDLTNALTLEAWIKPNALPAAGGWASVVTKPESYSLQFNGSRLEFTIMQNGTRQRLQAPPGAVVAGQSYHVVATYDGTTRRLYLNGVEVASAALTGGASLTTAGLFVGSWNGFIEFLNGTVDDVAVYGSALPAARVQNHFQVGSGAGTSPVTAPSSLSATAVSTSRIDLSWTDNSSNETGFVVERDTSASFSSPATFTVGANVTSFSSTGLASGSTYYYRVKAVNGTDSSAYSNTASTATLSTVPAPSGLAATAVSGSRIDVTWTDNSSNETNFVLERSTSASFTSPTSTTLAANATSASATGLTPGTTYYFRVKATNATDASGYSNTANATTPNPVTAPSGLSAAAVSSSQVDLAWTDNSSNETSFVVERDTSASFASPTAFTVAANATTYTDTSVAASTTYYYRVKGRNATDTSPPSGTASATTPAAPPAPTGYANTVAADSPTSHWRLGETSGTAAADASGANPGTYINGAALGQPSLLGSDAVNKAVRFDGTNDYVRVANSNSLQATAPLTLEAWIKPTVVPAAGAFGSVVTKPESYTLQFNGPRLELTIMQNGNRRRLQAPSGAIVAGQTYHVVGTYDGTTTRLYINGSQVATASLAGGATSTTNPLHIGSWDGTREFFNGVIDEVAFYRSALSATRVSAHYDAGR